MAVTATTTSAKIRINKRDKVISNVVRTNGIVTVTTSAAHGYSVGNAVVIAAVSNPSINGTFTILSVPSGTTFTYRQTVFPNGTTSPVDIATGSDSGSTLELVHITLPNGRDYVTSAADQDVFLPIAQYDQIDPKWLGTAPKLLTDQTA